MEMGRRATPGMYVKSLFKVLRVLGVPRLAVAQHLHVPPSAVSMWATGARPIPQHHYDLFHELVWSKIVHVQERCREQQGAGPRPNPEETDPPVRPPVHGSARPAAGSER